MTGNLRWTKFHWADWEGEQTLARCSMAAQGFWMRLLCIAASAEPFGYVVEPDGRPMTPEDLAFWTRQPVEDVRTWLAELRKRGVYTVDARGRIFCRRMVRDERISRQNSLNGGKGGNPRLTQQAEKHELFGGPVNPPLNLGVKAETETETGEEGGFRPVVHVDQSEEYSERIWKAATQPMRDRSTCREVLQAIKAVSRKISARDLLEALEAYVARDKDVRAGIGQPGLHRWIKAERWDAWRDQSVKAPAMTADRWLQALQVWNREGKWFPELGPKPGAPGCMVPAELLEDVGQ